MIERITEENFLLLAMHCYDNIQCTTIEEFQEDLKRFLYLKKLFNRYKNDGDLKERLILNHLIVLYNVFGDMATAFLFFKIDEEFWPQLVTFLTYINRLPILVNGIITSDIPLDKTIIDALRKI